MGKRCFDLVVSILFLLVASPVLAIIALAVKLDTSGPVFHTATRIGKDGRPFTLYKFRTMVRDAAQTGPAITRGGDPRVTRVGHFLRRYKMDELPQFINVVKGDMSIVGPRPEDPRYVAHYTPEQRGVLSVRPGIASPASVKYRWEEQVLAEVDGDLEAVYLNHILPDKLLLDLNYVQRRSLLFDLALIAQTAIAVLGTASGRGPCDGIGVGRATRES